jgi:predicted alpha/beta-hydrolase family hydrolase
MKTITSPLYSKHPACVLILAHGAGAPMDSPFMEQLAIALDREGIANVRFEFPYMEKRREYGKKRPPDRQPVLLKSFREAVAQVRSHVGDHCRVLVGGKSMGGRMASLLACEAEQAVDGVACFGYPFHAPGKPDNWRVDHFPQLTCPLLIVQGTRDPFGKAVEVEQKGTIEGVSHLAWLDGGNHDFQPLKKQPESHEQLIDQAARVTRDFIDHWLSSNEQPHGAKS